MRDPSCFYLLCQIHHLSLPFNLQGHLNHNKTKQKRVLIINDRVLSMISVFVKYLVHRINVMGITILKRDRIVFERPDSRNRRVASLSYHAPEWPRIDQISKKHHVLHHHVVVFLRRVLVVTGGFNDGNDFASSLGSWTKL